MGASLYETPQPLKRRPNVIPRVGGMAPIGEPPNPTGMVPAPGAITEPPNPTGMVGAPAPSKWGAQVGDETGHGIPPRAGLPGGGRTPGQVSGITPQLPPGPGGTARLPRPAARPLQRGSGAPVPPAPMPPAPIIEPPNPTGGVGVGGPIPPVGTFGPGNDMRFQTINPQASARTTQAGQATDQAAQQVQGFNPAQRAAQLSGEIGQQLLPQDVKFQGMPTSVNRRGINPNVQFQGVDTDINAGGRIDPTDSGDMGQFRGMRSQAAQNLTGGPSRSEIAQRELKAFDMESQPEIRDQMQAVARRTAALGRTGMGEASFEQSQPFVDYLTRRAAMESRLAGQTAEGEIQDRQNVLNATRGLVGEEESIGAGRRGEQRQDRSFQTAVDESNIGRRMQERDASLGLSERNLGRDMDLMDRDVALDERNLGRATSERDTALGLDERNVGRQYDARRAALEAGMGLAGQEGNYGLSRYGTMAGREQDLYGRDVGERNEQRGERDFQVGTAERATDRAVQNYGLEEDAQQRNFDRQMRLEALRLGQDPSGTMLGVSDRMGQRGQGAVEGAADLLGQYMAGRQGGGLNIPSPEEIERIKRGIKIPEIEVNY